MHVDEIRQKENRQKQEFASKNTTKKKISKNCQKNDCRKESRQTAKHVAKYIRYLENILRSSSQPDPNLNAT